jgi:hypothetical protein
MNSKVSFLAACAMIAHRMLSDEQLYARLISIAALEAVTGLFIELVLIATFSKRLLSE